MIHTEKDLHNGTQVVHKFENNYGASVVRHDFSYGRESGLFEIAVVLFDSDGDWSINYETPITDDVVGHLSQKEVDDILKLIELLPPEQE
jgi:hypothetical protein